MLPTLEIVGSAFQLDPQMLFGPGGPCCVCVSSPIPGLSLCLAWGGLTLVVMANDCCDGSKSWAQSSWFSSSPLCLRVKNPSWWEARKKLNILSVRHWFPEEIWREMLHKNTFHSMKMIRARSSKPPMMLPIRIHNEIGIARPFSTSSTVYRKIDVGRN